MQSQATDQRSPEHSPQPLAGLLDLAVRASGATAEPRPRSALAAEPSLDAALRYYLDRIGRPPQSKDELVGLLSRDVAALDDLLSGQVNAILHHPRFQQLEAAWRGLQYLVDTAEDREEIRILALHLPRRELAADLHGAMEFDQSALFRKVYEERYGMAGGEPFGALIGDYEFRNAPEDIDLLGKIAEVAAAAFAPFVAGAHPQMFGIPHFGLLERIRNLPEQFNSLRFLKWNSLRDSEDSRYVGLVLPHILMRHPYGAGTPLADGFLFQEDVTAEDRSGYLWGNAAFAFGAVLVRAFATSGWFADIRGTNQGPGAGGVVSGLPAPSFRTDRPGVALKSPVETMIGEAREKELSDLGFIALCDCEDTPYAAFFGNQSIQKPKVYDDQLATTNARMSSMLQYILCASRFAHYLKAIARDQVGRFRTPGALQSQLHSWVQQYVASDPSASASMRARFPLRDAKIEIRDHPRDPGHLLATLFLSPHVQLDELTASVRLVSDLRKD
jgi:type VI secretion system protein ImpC